MKNEKINHFFSCQWLKILVILGTVIYAAGQIVNTQKAMAKQIEQKVDKSMHNKDLENIRLEIKLQLQRIEGKIDFLTKHNQAIP